MKKRKLTRKKIDELAKVMPVLSEEIMRECVGGQDSTITYTVEQYHFLESIGMWTQTAYVSGMGYVLPTATVTGTYTDYEKYFDDNYSFNWTGGISSSNTGENQNGGNKWGALASSLDINMSVKEALFNLAKKTGDIGKAANTY